MLVKGVPDDLSEICTWCGLNRSENLMDLLFLYLPNFYSGVGWIEIKYCFLCRATQSVCKGLPSQQIEAMTKCPPFCRWHNSYSNFARMKTLGWVGLWGFLWWAPSAKGKDHHGVSSGWSSVWHRSNTGLSSTQYEQIPIILGIWPFWLTPFFFQSITFWRAYG